MKKYEYVVDSIPDRLLVVTLTDRGNDGWELVQIIKFQQGQEIVWKREII